MIQYMFINWTPMKIQGPASEIEAAFEEAEQGMSLGDWLEAAEEKHDVTIETFVDEDDGGWGSV